MDYSFKLKNQEGEIESCGWYDYEETMKLLEFDNIKEVFEKAMAEAINTIAINISKGNEFLMETMYEFDETGKAIRELDATICRCIELKKKYVEEDAQDKGEKDDDAAAAVASIHFLAIVETLCVVLGIAIVMFLPKGSARKGELI